jgi:hypothetical protein
MRDWHLGQRGRTVARGDRVGSCVWGMARSLYQAGALPNSLSPETAAGGGSVMPHPAVCGTAPLVNIAQTSKELSGTA